MSDRRDPLEQFRRKSADTSTRTAATNATPPPQPKPAVPMDEELQPPPPQFDTSTGKEIYRAFFVWSRRRERLEIRQSGGAWLYPRYMDLRDIIRNGEEATELVLPFPTYDVFIKGRNLQSLVYALSEGRCYFIQDFNSNQHTSVTERDAPIIESMAAVTREEKGKNLH